MGATNPCRKFGLLPCTDAGSGSWCWDRGTPRSATGKEASALPPLKEAPLQPAQTWPVWRNTPCPHRDPARCDPPAAQHLCSLTLATAPPVFQLPATAVAPEPCSTPRGGSTPYQPIACSACIPPAPAGQWLSWMMEDPVQCSAMRADGTSPDRTILTTHRH